MFFPAAPDTPTENSYPKILQTCDFSQKWTFFDPDDLVECPGTQNAFYGFNNSSMLDLRDPKGKHVARP